MNVFKCKMCGGSLNIDNERVATCEYCGSQQTIPKLEDERIANLYDRANHFRRNNEYDKAMGLYEQILLEDNSDAEAYWSLVLCRYGIEYVEDPTSHKRIPTVNRAQFVSILVDEDYKSAIKNATIEQKIIYEDEAKTIDEIQKGILTISQNEEPFDVFICYKETDNNGRRTRDSVIANDLYHQLTQEGYKVFFSRITLEDKIGEAYEPYIFAALHSSKVMIVLGTQPEHFNAVWVKNEWSRYLALIKNGEKKTLIPAYRDMDPYDLPDAFSHLQAQDMNKLGFMQDLIRGINKIVGSNNIETNSDINKPVSITQQTSSDVTSLLERAYIELEDDNGEKASALFDKVLDSDPHNAKAYFGQLIISEDVSVTNPQDFFACYTYHNKNVIQMLKDADIERISRTQGNKFIKLTFDDSEHIKNISNQYCIDCEGMRQEDIRKLYEKDWGYYSILESMKAECHEVLNSLEENKLLRRAISYADGEFKKELTDGLDGVKEHYNHIVSACEKFDSEQKERIEKSHREFINSVDDKVIETSLNRKQYIYEKANRLLGRTDEKDVNEAIRLFNLILDYKDSTSKIDKGNEILNDIRYIEAIQYIENRTDVFTLKKIQIIHKDIGDYKDLANRIEDYKEQLYIKANKSLKKKRLNSISNAKNIFENLEGYKDSAQKAVICEKKYEHTKKIIKTINIAYFIILFALILFLNSL